MVQKYISAVGSAAVALVLCCQTAGTACCQTAETASGFIALTIGSHLITVEGSDQCNQPVAKVIRLHIHRDLFKRIVAKEDLCNSFDIDGNATSCLHEATAKQTPISMPVAGGSATSFDDTGTVNTPEPSQPSTLPVADGGENWSTPLDVDLSSVFANAANTAVELKIILDDPGIKFLHAVSDQANNSKYAVMSGAENYHMFSCRSSVINDTFHGKLSAVRLRVSSCKFLASKGHPCSSAGATNYKVGGLNIGILVPVSVPGANPTVYLPMYIDPKILNDG